MRTIFTGLAMASAAFLSSSANAQMWGGYSRGGPAYYQPWGGYNMGAMVQSVCSGQRGFALENQLRHEQREGEIDPYTASRIHYSIDRLEAKQWHECSERDWGAIRNIAHHYDRVAQWIDAQAHAYAGWER